jgi:hypothetical protein
VDAIRDHLHRCGWSLGVACFGATWLVELRRGGLHGQASLARQLGVSTALVCLICNGKVWRHLP